MYKIGIIGTGKIGSQLAKSVLSLSSLSELHLINRSRNKLEGEMLSLQLYNHIIGSNIDITELDWKEIDRLDLLVICIKDNYDPRILQSEKLPHWIPNNLRYVGLPRDLPLLKLLSDKIASFSGKICVITNPVEIVSYFLSKWIPRAKVFGLGASLDAARLSFFIQKELNYDFDKNFCIVAGEHGNEIFPVSKFLYSDKNLTHLTSDQMSNCLNQTMKIGFEIVKKLGFTLLDCIPVFVNDINWLLKEPVGEYKSFAIQQNNCFISKPLKIIKNSKVELFCDYTPNEKILLAEIESKLTNLLEIFEAKFSELR